MRHFKRCLLPNAAGRGWVILALMSTLGCGSGAHAQTFVLASTTSTQQSGLFEHLLPQFQKATGMQPKVVAVGTGQAIDMGRRGDADVLFVHDKVAEEKVVAEGHAVKRFEVMYNDFVLIGPKADPVKARGNDVVAGLKRIAAANEIGRAHV